MDQLSEKFHDASPYAYVMNNPAMFFDPDGRDMEPWIKGMWDATNSSNRNDTNWTNTGTGFQGDFGNGNEMAFVNFKGTFDYVIQQVIIKARGNANNWNSGGNLAFNQAVMGGKVLNALQNFNYMMNKSTLAKAINESEVAQSIGRFENFLFMDVPLFFAGGSAASSFIRGAGYLRGALLRGATDLATQAAFKNGEVDMRQLTINTFVGIGGKNYQAMAKVAGANLGLNTANNFATSELTGSSDKDVVINSAKIVTGVLGGAFGIVGGGVVGSIYGNGMDAYFNNVNDNYYER